MFRFVTRFLADSPNGCLFAPEEGASTAEGEAGVSQTQEDIAESDPSDSGRSTAGTEPDATDDDDIDADDDFSDVPFHEHPRFKSVTKKLAKARRQLSRLRPVAERFKGVDLDALGVRARVAEQLEGVLTKRPDLRKAVMEALSSGDDPPPAAKEPEFDAASLPFDVNDDVGKYFVSQHKRMLELERQLKTALGEVDGVKRERTQAAFKAHESTWKTATLAAAAQLPENVREMFTDTMYGAYRVALAEGKQLNPQAFVNQYVDKLRKKGHITARAAQRSSDAAAQRIAQNNRSLPRRPAGGGAPSSARGDHRETVADVNKRIRAMLRSA